MDDLLEYLKEEEGFVSSVYQDHLGYWTIGYGRMVDVRRGGGITKAEASDLLMNDVERIQRSLSERIPWFYDVPWRVGNILVAMAFQMGIHGNDEKRMIYLHCATVNTCNARCNFCAYKSPENTRPKGHMSMELFRKIVDDASTNPHIGSMAFSALGEPLLDPFLEERIAYAKEKCPHWSMIDVYTNGVFLTPEKFLALQAAGIGGISISLNAINHKQHEAVMGLKGKYSTVVANARYAIDHADGMTIRVKAVCGRDSFTLRDASYFLTMWGKVEEGGYGVIVKELNWAGKNRTINAQNKWKCPQALGSISILHDGTVSLCCFDPFAEYKLGDLNTQSLREIYNGEFYTKFREDHDLNRFHKYPICASCTKV
jgi:radical SAM protein with 4Fe4S-binding SPASM domain